MLRAAEPANFSSLPFLKMLLQMSPFLRKANEGVGSPKPPEELLMHGAQPGQLKPEERKVFGHAAPNMGSVQVLVLKRVQSGKGLNQALKRCRVARD